MAETKKRKYKRTTVTKALEDLKKRITEINEDDYYLYKITKVIIFGSYVNTNNDYIHDLDVAIEIRCRTEVYGNSGEVYVEQSYERYAKSKTRLQSIYASYYGKKEVYKALKNKNSIISIHQIPYDKEAVFSNKYEVIFEEDLNE